MAAQDLEGRGVEAEGGWVRERKEPVNIVARRRLRPGLYLATVQSMQVNLPRQLLRLRVSGAAESALRSGHPWVWAESCREQSRAGQLGELAVIYDRQERFLAISLFDPPGPLPVRGLHTGEPQTIDAAWGRTRPLAALERPAGPFDAPATRARL